MTFEAKACTTMHHVDEGCVKLGACTTKGAGKHQELSVLLDSYYVLQWFPQVSKIEYKTPTGNDANNAIEVDDKLNEKCEPLKRHDKSESWLDSANNKPRTAAFKNKFSMVTHLTMKRKTRNLTVNLKKKHYQQ
jgi:hypothetical protein